MGRQDAGAPRGAPSGRSRAGESYRVVGTRSLVSGGRLCNSNATGDVRAGPLLWGQAGRYTYGAGKPVPCSERGARKRPGGSSMKRIRARVRDLHDIFTTSASWRSGCGNEERRRGCRASSLSTTGQYRAAIPGRTQRAPMKLSSRYERFEPVTLRAALRVMEQAPRLGMSPWEVADALRELAAMDRLPSDAPPAPAAGGRRFRRSLLLSRGSGSRRRCASSRRGGGRRRAAPAARGRRGRSGGGAGPG
jgi:hypothetical protein